VKTLYLLRHAKSSWNDPGLSDHDRPLAPRGDDAAPRIGRTLRELGVAPDRVLCSSAERARRTWDLVGRELDTDAPAERREDLYDASPADVVAAVQDTPADAEALMVVGHNPTMERLAETLAGDGDPAALREMAAKFPTGALAELRFDTRSWTAVAPGAGHLARFLKPKKLPDPAPDPDAP